VADPTPAIRLASDEDGPDLSRLIAGVFAEYENCPFVPEEFPELVQPATYYARRGGQIWVVDDPSGQGLAGSLAIAATHRPGIFELFKVYLAKSARRAGLASRMLAVAEEFAIERGGERLVLWSDSRFEDGHAFYLRRGFHRVAGLRALHDAADTLEFGFAKALPTSLVRR
jgi:putative acetyltransferase